jgi:hypothetical protein
MGMFGPSERRRRSTARIGSAVVLIAVTFGARGSAPGLALGAVDPVTPFQTSPPALRGRDPGVSGRGEAIGVLDDGDGTFVAFVQYDTAGPEPKFEAETITVSGNACRALWTDNGNNEQTIIGLIDRCNPSASRTLFTLPVATFPYYQGALSFDGRYAALQISASPRAVYRIDIDANQVAQLPAAGLPGADTDARFGIDISDDGNIVAVSMREDFVIGFAGRRSALGTDGRNLFVAAWDVAAGAVSIINDVGQGTVGSAAYPSVSGDGRYVAFASDFPLAGGESGGGPWVYVRDRAAGATRLVSPGNAASYYTSISNDATQLAYGTGGGPCTIGDLTEFQCPPAAIAVAYGPTPGMAGAFQTEIVSRTPQDRIVGQHHQPSLSGNGRWIAWRSDQGDVLTGQKLGLQGQMHVFRRQRDAGLVITTLDFGAVTAGGNSTLTSTITNSGRTTLSIDDVTTTGTGFALRSRGTCPNGLRLAPGASCTVDVRFTAPGTAGTVTGTLNVAERGFEPFAARGSLLGMVTIPTTTSPPTTVPGTTVPATTVPGTTVPGTTVPGTTVPATTVVGQGSPVTVAGRPQLVADPGVIDYGPVAVGIVAEFRVVTVSNVGTGGGVVETEMLGANPGDFFVNGNQCADASLAPGASCTISVAMIATTFGVRSAELSVTSGGDGGSVSLTGEGRFLPRLTASPAAVTLRGLTTVIGQGFPVGQGFEVHIGDGLVVPVVADGSGTFRIPLSPLAAGLRLGSYVMRVNAMATVFDEVRGAMVVVLPTFEPQGPGGPAFGEALIVTRGG